MCTDHVTYKQVVDELTASLQKRLGSKLNKVIVKDIDTDDFDICVYLVLNVSREQQMEIYLEALDNIVDLELKYNLVVCTLPFSIDEFNEKSNPTYVTEKYLNREIFDTEEEMMQDACNMEREKCFRQKVRELHNSFNIPIQKICQTYTITEQDINIILNNNDEDINSKMWWID